MTGMEPVLDKCGQPITVGAYIIYGHALGRCAGLRIGKVLALKKRRENYTGDPGVSITVMGVNDDYWVREIGLCNKKGTLMYPNRVVVVPKSMIPETHRELLKDVK